MLKQITFRFNIPGDTRIDQDEMRLAFSKFATAYLNMDITQVSVDVQKLYTGEPYNSKSVNNETNPFIYW